MTTVKIDSEDDELLERLRAKMILRGKKMTKKNILGHLIKKATEYEELFSNDKIDDSIPLEEDPMWKILSNPDETGIRDTSTNIDKFVY